LGWAAIFPQPRPLTWLWTWRKLKVGL